MTAAEPPTVCVNHGLTAECKVKSETWESSDPIERGQGTKEVEVPHTRIWTKWFFFLGFLCPILWVIGSKLSLNDYNAQNGFIWKKRCRIAVTIMLTLGIVGSVLVMIFNPQAFGLRKNTSVGPQTSSNSNSALRPDVPVNGTSTTGDIIAGIIIAGQNS
ncbi:hypothetical protein BC943DRAFT_361458 [Umbelopsis sp. AD052]|nr:hypothetical protein BC943DRAFT_361458 [Umbelopsis sp. AD052]